MVRLILSRWKLETLFNSLTIYIYSNCTVNYIISTHITQILSSLLCYFWAELSFQLFIPDYSLLHIGWSIFHSYIAYYLHQFSHEYSGLFDILYILHCTQTAVVVNLGWDVWWEQKIYSEYVQKFPHSLRYVFTNSWFYLFSHKFQQHYAAHHSSKYFLAQRWWGSGDVRISGDQVFSRDMCTRLPRSARWWNKDELFNIFISSLFFRCLFIFPPSKKKEYSPRELPLKLPKKIHFFVFYHWLCSPTEHNISSALAHGYVRLCLDW